jgi:hypothetical protein
MATLRQWFDLTRKAAGEYLRATEIPNVNPEKLDACEAAVTVCMKGILDKVDEETSFEELAHISTHMHEVQADLVAVRRTAERQLGKLLHETEKEDV